MISEKAVEAALTAYMDGDSDQAKWLIGKERLEGSPAVRNMRAALSAALPLLLEDYLAQAWFAGATMMGTNNPSGTTTVVDNAKAYADRIIAMLGGGE